LVEGLESLDDNERAIREIDSPSGRVKVWLGVEWLPMCSDEFLQRPENSPRSTIQASTSTSTSPREKLKPV
jgi:hypothetical protein